MPYIKLSGKKKTQYITPKQFFEEFSLSKSRGYQLLNMPEMKEAILKTGPRGKKVDLEKATCVMKQLYN